MCVCVGRFAAVSSAWADPAVNAIAAASVIEIASFMPLKTLLAGTAWEKTSSMIRSTLKGFCFLGLAGAFALIACGDDEVTEKYPSADSFCSGKADAECKAGAEVCGATADACKAKRTSVCQAAASAATGRGGVYRPQNAEKCINDTTALYASKVVDLAKEKEVDETCSRVFSGSKKKSENCTTSNECEGTLICDRNLCAEKVAKALDEACNNPGDTCGTGTYCGPRGGSNFCNKKNEVGDICGDTTPCLENLRCVPPDGCKERLGAGEVCDKPTDCTTGFCGTDKKCAARLVPGDNGCADFK